MIKNLGNTRKRRSSTNWILIIVLLCCCAIVGNSVESDEASVEINAVGDILLGRGVKREIERLGTRFPFSETEQILRKADITFGNLETVLSLRCRQLPKKYIFNADPEYGRILKDAGFDLLSLSNNHSFDCGEEGITETSEVLRRFGVRSVGSAFGTDADAAHEVFIVKGIRIAFLAFSAINPLPSLKETQTGLETERVRNEVMSARKDADVVIVSFHWGTENSSTIDQNQLNLEKAAYGSGADVILGHHPHVLQGLRMARSPIGRRMVLTAFSLGNFLFDSPVRLNKRFAESGILNFRVNKNGITGAKLIPITIENYRPVFADSGQSKLILNRIRRLSVGFSTAISESGEIVPTDGISENGSNAFKTSISFDLDGDGMPEEISIDSGSKMTLEVRRGGELLWNAVPAAWEPWKLQIADVDGDGQSEIVVGVYKSTKFFPKPHNCLFIYSWANGKGAPKWLGSSLSRPFNDFIFADFDGRSGDELAALETTRTGSKSLSFYRWNGFGFTRESVAGDWKAARIIGAEGRRVLLETDGQRNFISMKNNRE